MPRTLRRRRKSRSLPPRPTYSGAPEVADEALSRDERPIRYVQRESPHLISELWRVGAVSVVSFGLLFALVLVDRIS